MKPRACRCNSDLSPTFPSDPSAPYTATVYRPMNGSTWSTPVNQRRALPLIALRQRSTPAITARRYCWEAPTGFLAIRAIRQLTPRRTGSADRRSSRRCALQQTRSPWYTQWYAVATARRSLAELILTAEALAHRDSGRQLVCANAPPSTQSRSCSGFDSSCPCRLRFEALDYRGRLCVCR